MVNIFDTDEISIQKLIEERKIKVGDFVEICGYVDRKKVSIVNDLSLTINVNNKAMIYEVKGGKLNILLI